MTNTLGVCLLIAFFCCTNLSLARQVPKECSNGPSYWCQDLRRGADCGAVGHCIATVWEHQNVGVNSNKVSDRFVRLFRQLKDVKDLINEDYLGQRVSSECHDVSYPAVAAICKANTAEMSQYLYHVLISQTTPETMCQVIGMCNNLKVDKLLSSKKKADLPDKLKNHLVGSSHCTWGPSYWCSNFTTGRECTATKHCVERVWPKRDYPEDNDSVCTICTDMVKQARNQLQSNQTQEQLKEVFEGSCKLMPVKIISKECIKLADDFVPELVETLASEMNPQQVCSVAGLCNNARIDRILEATEKTTTKPEKTDSDIVADHHLVGAARCTWGPSYWCTNFSTGRDCGATKHCVQTVWTREEVPVDSDDICKICTDMVKQARDQLQSNETQEELKEVFEGSCKLIPIKIVAKECMKLADDFVPELVETLASEMNPQQVCSVAGLCNSERIDQMLEGYKTQLSKVVSCNNCRQTVGVARKKFDHSTYEDFLLSLLQVCRKMDSLSDSCSMLVFKYYENILEGVRKDLTPHSVCHLSGQCTYRFHTHDLYTFPASAVQGAPNDDVPCEFCEQVVKHLRDVLVANTTETEFYKVLKGLCKQTGEFKEECLHIADQYYPLIYKFLVSDLDPVAICNTMGLCGKKQDVPIAPLVPNELAVKAIPLSSKLIGQDEANSYATEKIGRVSVPSKQTNVRVMGTEEIAPLPIERMFVRVPQGKTGCAFCQYFLHYLQVELSDAKTEDKITDAVDKACDHLPRSLNGECRTFVTQYGPAVIALLVQEIDPASVCPALGLCAAAPVRRVSVNADKSNCPLCLFAVEQLETMLKSNRTETTIRQALNHLCNHLSNKLQSECVDFVETYTNQLVEMLVANMNAQEICVYLHLCKDTTADPIKVTSSSDKYHEKPQLRGDRNNFRKKSMLPKHLLEDAEIETNEIPDDTVNGRVVAGEVRQKTVCVVCEFVMREIDDQIKDKHNEDEIKKVVHSVCKHMPKSVRSDCDQFVEKYADLVISLLAQELEPDEVCQELKLCAPQTPSIDVQQMREEILDCAVCETVVVAVKKVLSNDRVDRNIVHIVEKSCSMLPAKYSARCHTMMEIYGDSVIHLIETLGTKGLCQKIGMCGPAEAARLRMRASRH